MTEFHQGSIKPNLSVLPVQTGLIQLMWTEHEN